MSSLSSRSFYSKFSPFLLKVAHKNSYYVNTPHIRNVVDVRHLNLTQRFYSNNGSPPIATFEEVQQVPHEKNVLLIDVREPTELKETGIIPGSINIPLGDVENVLKQTSPQEFRKKFGKDKPEENTEIIFHCMIGKRSGVAQEIANKLGYRNVKNYLGSWTEWAERIKSE